MTARLALAGRAFAALAFVAASVACTPNVTFRRVDFTSSAADSADAANPAQREVAFALQTSSVVISAPTDEALLAEVKAGKCPYATFAQKSKDCLAGATFTLVPDRDDAHVYLARLGRGTKLSVVPFDTDPLLPKTVTQAFVDPAAATLTQVFGVAASGFKAAGPWAAFAAAGIESGVTVLRVTVLAVDSDKLQAALCPDVDIDKVVLPDNPAIRFPFAIHRLLPDDGQPPPRKWVGAAGPGENQACWHSVLRNDEKDSNAGWFYRVIPGATSEKVRSFPPSVGDPGTEKVFVAASDLEVAAARDYWPVSACRHVSLEIAWWQSLLHGPISTGPVFRKDLVVSDPAMVQRMSLTRDGRVITVKSSCGGYATSAAAADQPGVLAAALKGYNDLKDAEAAYRK